MKRLITLFYIIFGFNTCFLFSMHNQTNVTLDRVTNRLSLYISQLDNFTDDQKKLLLETIQESRNTGPEDMFADLVTQLLNAEKHYYEQKKKILSPQTFSCFDPTHEKKGSISWFQQVTFDEDYERKQTGLLNGFKARLCMICKKNNRFHSI